MQTNLLFSTAWQGARWMIVALTVALAGAFVSVAHAQAASAPAPQGHFGHGGFGDGRMLERMLDSVNASPDQRSRIHDIMKSAMTDLKTQRESARNLHDQALTLFAQPTVDARAVESVRQQMLQQHDQASRRWMQAMLDASAVLTPDQRAQLAERMKQRRDMMQQRHQRNRSGQEQPTG